MQKDFEVPPGDAPISTPDRRVRVFVSSTVRELADERRVVGDAVIGRARARLPLVTITVFAALTLVATLLHRDRFHFAVPMASARFAAWVWLAVYVAVPIGLVFQIWRQHRLPGPDPESRRPWPPAMT